MTQLDSFCFVFILRQGTLIYFKARNRLISGPKIGGIDPSLDFWKIYLKKMEFDNLHFWFISNLILTACVACKFQVQNWPKLKFLKLHLLKTIFQKSSACLMTLYLRVSLRVEKNPHVFYLSFGCLHQFQYLSITFVVSQCNVCTCCIGCSKIIVSRWEK